MRVHVVGHFVAACAVSLASARTAAAAGDGTAPLRYVLSSVRGAGAEDCPGTPELAREVERRLGRAVFEPDAPRSLEVHVERSPEGYRSRVFVRDAEQRTLGQRELTSEEPSCAPLFSATALALALLIDPDASLAADAPSAAPATEPTPLAAPARSVALEPAKPAPLLDVSRRLSPSPSSTNAATLRASGVVAFGVVPGAVPGVEVAFGARPGRGPWGWELASLYLVSGVTEPGASGEFSIGLTALGVVATLDLVDAGAVLVTAHAGPWVGALHTTVRAPAPRNPGDFLYLALAAGLRARFPLAAGWFTEAAGAARVPLVREGFFVGGRTEPSFRQPALSADLGLGVGVELL